MNPIALTISAALCFACGYQGRATEVSSRRPPAVEEPDSPENAIALNARAGAVSVASLSRIRHA